MVINFNDTINGSPCIISVKTGKNSKILAVSGIVVLLPPDNFIFKIGNLHPDDLQTVDGMYKKYLENS